MPDGGRKRKSQKAELLTSSPFKNMLQEQAEMRCKPSKKVAVEKHSANKKAKKPAKTPKAGRARPKQKSGLKGRQVKADSKKRVDNCDSLMVAKNTEIYSATFCLVCGENFDEEWIQCGKCSGWAHTECADVHDALYYYCDNCA